MSQFDDPKFKATVAKQLGLKSKDISTLILPELGEMFLWQGVVWKVTFVKTNPMRFTVEPDHIPEEKKEETCSILKRAKNIFQKITSPEKK